jgi:hypothetical protein
MYGRVNTRKISQIEAIQITKHLSLLIVDPETGIFKPVSVDWGRETTIRTSDMGDGVLDPIPRNVGVSTREERKS